MPWGEPRALTLGRINDREVVFLARQLAHSIRRTWSTTRNIWALH
jgi:hypothetical protein